MMIVVVNYNICFHFLFVFRPAEFSKYLIHNIRSVLIVEACPEIDALGPFYPDFEKQKFVPKFSQINF